MVSLLYETCKADLNQKSDKKMKYSMTPISCVIWMTFLYPLADAMLEWLHKFFPLKLGFSSPGMYLMCEVMKDQATQ